MSDAALLAELRTIARDRLARAEALLARVVAEDEGATRELARELHTLKGEARIVGLADVAALVHEAEDAGVALSREPRSKEALAALHAALDRVSEEIAKLVPAEEEETSATDGARVPIERIARIERITSALRAGELDRGRVSHETAALARELRALRRSVDADSTLWSMRAHVEALEKRAGVLAAHARAVTSDVREQVEELESAGRALGLVPLGALLGPQQAAVRRMAEEHGKQVVLTVSGADVEVDREVLDAIAEPLVHLLRNAIDHGLETPDERLASGKRALGEIRIDARPDGNEVELLIADDGRGIDLEAVRARAVQLGVLSADRSAKEDVLRAVLAPGLSTRTEAGATSGRGVGLDVVAHRVRALGGEVSVRSERGLGACFVLRLPASALVGRALVVEAAGHSWALPAGAVRGLADDDVRIERAGSGSVLRQGDAEPVRYARLDALLGMGTRASDGPQHDRIVLVGAAGQEIALGVDRCRGVSRATVRGDSVLVSDLPLVRGVAVLTDGEAVPLLDAEALARAEEHSVPRPRGSAVPTARDEARRRVLVVDDSELMRDVAASTLRGMGHEVDEAVDGRDALARIEARLPDLVVTDLDMPVLDGFALIERLRAEPRTARVPIVVLTSNETDASMRRAGALGADAYVLKSRVSRAEIERTVLGLFAQSPLAHGEGGERA